MKQHDWETAQPWSGLGHGTSQVRQLDSTLLCFTLPHSACSGPARHFSVSVSAGEMQSSVGREIVLPEPRGTDSYSEKSLLLVPGWSVLMQMRTLNCCSFMVHKTVSWLVKMELLWLVCEDADGAVAVRLRLAREKPQSYWLKHNSRNSLTGSYGRNVVQAGNSVQSFPWSAVCVRVPTVFKIWAHLAIRSPL